MTNTLPMSSMLSKLTVTAAVNPLTRLARRSVMQTRYLAGFRTHQQDRFASRDVVRRQRRTIGKGLSMKRVSFALISALTAFAVQPALAQAQDKPKDRGTLQGVKDRGSLSCGVSQGLPGFSSPDDKGNWTGLDVDVCRALAAAIFNDSTKVKFVPLSAKDRFTALQSGEIDVLSRNSTWTLSRDTSLGLNYTGISYYDGQGFMIRKSLKVNSALELNSASICVQTGTTNEQNVSDYFKGNNMKYELIAFGTADETFKAYESGRCDVFTSDVSQLYA